MPSFTYTTNPINTLGEEVEVELTVDYDATYDPGNVSGPWEDSYPPEGDMTINSTKHDYTPAQLDELHLTEGLIKASIDDDKIDEAAWEDYHATKNDDHDDQDF